MVDDRGDDSRFDPREKQTIAIRFARTTLRPSTERRFDGGAAGRAVTLPRMPYAQGDRGCGLTGFARAGMRRESAQIDPIESRRRVFEQRFRGLRLRLARPHFGERIVRTAAARRFGYRGGFGCGPHACHVHGDHVPSQSSAVGAEEHGERRRMRFELRRNIGARKLREAHVHVGIVGDRALAVRHRHFAILDEDDFRGRFRQHFGEQVGLAASRHFVVDVALGERQERQRLRQRQW